ncbi:MAG: hypothetical protein LBB56_08155 [Chitinispirillales bacterium]|jgi:hypothetical protein|nr:hypothetical protein [Chitinispirillales bacterium]
MALPNRIRIFYPPYTEDSVFEPSPFGRRFEKSRETIAREERTASGLLRRDLIALKWTFTLGFQLIDKAELDRFENLVNEHSNSVLKMELTFADTQGGQNGIKVSTYNVLISPFSSTRLRFALWENVSITFAET